jgi:hypothetical protein
MKRKIIFSWLAILVVVIAVVVLVTQKTDDSGGCQRGETQYSESSLDIRHTSSVTQQALESPEEFQEQTVDHKKEPVPLTVPTNRPALLSEVTAKDTATEEHPLAIQKTPVAAEDLYFWEDYASLRKEEIRNPESDENRAGVIALLKARQHRAQK